MLFENLDEHYFPGGVYVGEERTDIYLNEGNLADRLAPEAKLVCDLVIVNGSSTYTLLELGPSQIRAVARWMLEIAQAVETKERSGP